MKKKFTFKIGDKVRVIKMGGDLDVARIQVGFQGVVEIIKYPGFIGVRFSDDLSIEGHNLEKYNNSKSGWYISSKFLKKISKRKNRRRKSKSRK